MMNGDGIKSFRIIEGYVISEFQQTLDAQDALDFLTSEKQFECTSVSKDKDGDCFTILQHKFFCNSCNQRTPAYPHFFNNRIPPLKFRFKDVQKWVTQSTSLPEGECDKVALYEPIGDEGKLICPRCGKELQHYNRDNVNIIVKSQDDMVSVMCAYDEEHNMVKNEQIAVCVNSGEPRVDGYCRIKDNYIYETINFDLKQAKVFTTYCSFKNELSTDEAEGTQIASMGLSDLIDENAFLKCVLISLFKVFWKKKGYENFPFKENELDSAKFVLLTRFVGYDKKFYERVQMLMDDKHPPKTISDEVRLRLHYKIKNEKLYSSLGLPQEEGIKAVVLESPEYMLCHDLIKVLYDKAGAEFLLEFLSEEPKAFDLLWKFSTFEQEVMDRYETYIERGAPYRRNSKLDKQMKRRIAEKVYQNFCDSLENAYE